MWNLGWAIVASLDLQMGQALKTRSPRQKVLITTRMRVSAGWTDACILNISARGLMIQAASPSPARGSYVEIRRGARIIIGRVMWSEQRRFGLATQDQLDVESIIALPGGDPDSPPSSPAVTAGFERRSAVRRHATVFERSRQWSSAFEFVCIAVFGAAGCMLAFGAMTQVFVAPMAAVERGFGARPVQRPTNLGGRFSRNAATPSR